MTTTSNSQQPTRKTGDVSGTPARATILYLVAAGTYLAVGYTLFPTTSPIMPILVLPLVAGSAAALFFSFRRNAPSTTPPAIDTSSTGRFRRRWYGDACLANLGQLALTVDDDGTMFDEVINVLKTNLGCDMAEVLELSPDQSRFTPRVSVGWPDRGPDPFDLGSCPLYREVVSRREPAVVNHSNLPGDIRTPPTFSAAGIKHSLIIALRGSHGLFGTMGAHKRADEPFNEDDRHFLQGVANILSMTVENRRVRTVQNRLAAAVDQAAEAIIITDPDGTVIYVNPAQEQITGYHRDELLGTNWRLWTGRSAASPSQEIWDTLLRGESWRGRYTSKRKDGATYQIEATVAPVRDSHGRLVHFVAVERDTTREHNLASQLRQSQKLEAVGTLTGGIAHDFNNVLSVIISNSDLLASSIPAELTDLQNDVADIQKAARSGAAMIRKLLGFSRQADLCFEFVRINQLVDDTAGMLSRLLPDSIHVEVEKCDEPLTVHADAGALEQVIINLATNARDAMPGGGRLSIRPLSSYVDAERAGEHSTRPGSYVCIEISDEGCGMSEETVARVFEPFFTTKSQGMGTGLGMAMIYGLVKQHSGFVGVSSEPGVGTTVSVFLPATAATTAEMPVVTANSEVQGGSETILFAEDQESLRRTGKRVLERYGYRVLLAEDGVEALSRFRRAGENIDLVVSDLVMPNMGAKELMDAIREDRPDQKFMIASGHTLRDVVETEHLDPDIPFLEKPWTLESLTARVREVLDS